MVSQSGLFSSSANMQHSMLASSGDASDPFMQGIDNDSLNESSNPIQNVESDSLFELEHLFGDMFANFELQINEIDIDLKFNRTINDENNSENHLKVRVLGLQYQTANNSNGEELFNNDNDKNDDMPLDAEMGIRSCISTFAILNARPKTFVIFYHY